MRRLTIREDFALHDQSRVQRKNTEQQDRVKAAGAAAVRQMFPGHQASPGVERELAAAVSRLERCREQDTDSRGDEHPSPLTLSTLDLGVPEHMRDMPQMIRRVDASPEEGNPVVGRKRTVVTNAV